MEFSDGKLKQKDFFHSVQYSSLQCGREEAGNLGQCMWVKASISIPLFSISSYGIILIQSYPEEMSQVASSNVFQYLFISIQPGELHIEVRRYTLLLLLILQLRDKPMIEVKYLSKFTRTWHTLHTGVL